MASKRCIVININGHFLFHALASYLLYSMSLCLLISTNVLSNYHGMIHAWVGDSEGFMMKVLCGVCMDGYLIHRLAKSGM
jgi:hypothetical protein